MVPDAELEALYRALLLPRAIEDKMLALLRRGQLSKWFSGMGQEAISVRSCCKRRGRRNGSRCPCRQSWPGARRRCAASKRLL